MRNTDAGILHNQEYAVGGAAHPEPDLTVIHIILDGVLHQIEDHLVHFIRRSHHHAVLCKDQVNTDITLIRQRRQHMQCVRDHISQINAASACLLVGRIVHTGQGQQLLRNAHQPVGLSPDVLYKIADGLRIHVGILGNRVSQQLDGGQRRLQLM